MANTGFISMAPQIAAVQTVVDAIRATDVPVLTAGIATIAADTNNIRTVDVPAIDAAITAKVRRGQFKVGYLTTAETTSQDVINITGSGQLYRIACEAVSQELRIIVTIDGVAGSERSLTADTTGFLGFKDPPSVTDDLWFECSEELPDISVEYKTSLRVQIRCALGGGTAKGLVYYAED